MIVRATHRNTLQHTATCITDKRAASVIASATDADASVLQCVAVCCSVLQCVAVCCIVL